MDTPRGETWWTALHDPAIDKLVSATLDDNPTLAQAIANLDEARATLRVSNAQRLPQVTASGSAARAQTANPELQGGSLTILENSAALGPNLSWELDLWGRLQESARAASDRLDARTADAAGTRLSLAAQVANTVLALRACNYSLAVRDDDIASRTLERDLMRQRLAHGNVAPVDEANAATNLASARTDRISQQEQCTRDVDALMALTGRDAASVRALTDTPAASRAGAHGLAAPLETDTMAVIAKPPPLQPALPATVLLSHPTVVSAEREAAARWSEIAVARANRLPQIDLSALLAGNWLRALGTGLSFETWSLGASLTAPLFDAGAGAGNVAGSEARYREAVASLRIAVRTAAQNVEDALAAQDSAEQRVVTSQQAVTAGRVTLVADEARWRAGAISLFELEDARRQFNSAQESAIGAARDRAQTWVNLVQALGGASARADAPAPRTAATETPPDPAHAPSPAL